ncbi:MAG TPA: glycosyltransferase family 2 protein [Nocardioides sp.]|nr:glycosyltransferase family 2 protein [Nocardioides sp.]
MLITASTVKDTLPNVQRFVGGNLAGGVDHMVVFLDAPGAEGQGEVREWLEEQPHVTTVRTGKQWWAGDRPGQLNVRQRINVNLLKHVLARGDWAEWLFHIDGDEIVQVDRAVLDTVPAGTPAVRLAPLEAVSRMHWDGDPTWFKTLLDDDDLALIHALGVIDRPGNGAYFHGHVEGKSGLRPGAEGWLTLHKAVDADRENLESFEHEALQVLHYESYSGEDFVRKWTAMVASGPTASFRPARGNTAVALRALIGKNLGEEKARAYLMKLFERTTEDDFETLRDLDLLVEVDPRLGTHRPADAPAEGLDAMRAALDELRTEPKRRFHPAQAREEAEGKVKAVRSLLRRS